MIIDPNLEKIAPWKMLTGPSIGGVTPTSFGMNYLDDATEFYTSGPAFADWLAAISRPVLPNSGKLSLLFTLRTDANAPNLAQALEFDTRLSIGGWNYNFSSQFNYAEGGMWQLALSGHWTDTGFKPGKFTPDVKYPLRIDYAFDTTKQVGSVLGIHVGVKQFAVPAGMQNQPATDLKWADGANLQCQLDLASAGGAYSIYLSDVEYQWS